jgi:hypothetical protein
MLFGPMDQHGKSSVGIDWTDKKRNKVKLDVHAHLKMVIKKFALDQKCHGAFQLVGYTSYRRRNSMVTPCIQNFMQMNIHMGALGMIGA